MLSVDERKKLEHDFAEAEASVRLEGLTPSENSFAVKKRVLNGEISFEQGYEEILSFHREKHFAVA